MKRYSITLGLILMSNACFAAPNIHIERLAKQGQRAMLDCKPQLMESSYAQILKFKPHDENAAFNVALAQSWQVNKMELASKNFEAFIKVHPNHQEAWLAYANLESWKQNFEKAFMLLEGYKQRFGTTQDYLSTRARVLTLSGYYNQALAINTPLLNANPHNYDLVHTQTNALLKANRFAEARRHLHQLEQIECKNNDTKELENDFYELSYSPLTAGVDYYFDNQTLKNIMFPLSFDWTLNDNTRILFRGLHEVVIAGSQSNVKTINNHTTIYDDSLMAGVKWRIIPTIALTGLVGDLKIEGLHDKFIYWAGANFKLDEKVNLDITHFHNLYRPYLYPTSPKAVSMGITEYLTSANLNWQPWLNANMHMFASYSLLSDDNHYTHIDLAPNREFILNTKMTATFGADAEFLIFSKDPHNGYYAPKFFQQYLLTAGLNYNPTSNFRASISAGAGVHGDNFSDKLDPAARAYAGLSYLAKPCEFGISLDYTYQDAGHEFRAYQGLSTEAHITVRL